jgi:hypothetical protein
MKQFSYVPKKDRIVDNNKISKYASTMMKSEFNKFGNTKLINDYKKLLDDGCVYIPNYYCSKNDLTIFNHLKDEIKTQDPINWSKHMKYENPTFSETFNEIVDKLGKDFKITVSQTRLNYYRDHNDWKPFHHDSHAYGTKEENYTLGVSFGGMRVMEFIQDDIDDIDEINKTKDKFSFPQHNGDIFGFTKEVNKKFMHGIPKGENGCGERFSIIIWGKI